MVDSYFLPLEGYSQFTPLAGLRTRRHFFPTICRFPKLFNFSANGKIRFYIPLRGSPGFSPGSLLRFQEKLLKSLMIDMKIPKTTQNVYFFSFRIFKTSLASRTSVLNGRDLKILFKHVYINRFSKL